MISAAVVDRTASRAGSRRTAWGLLAVAAVVIGGHAIVVRPRQLTWGATPEEVTRPLPGDDMVARPTFNATRAISIAVPPAAVWPWLVQVGINRAGWYSYDLLDNLGRRSARRIVPELQSLAVGDVMPMSPDGRQGIPVHSLDPPRTMIWGTPGDTSWVWQLDAQPDGTTRLITRIRSRVRWSPISIAFWLLLEIADFWMIRRMLLNLRDRAESHPIAPLTALVPAQVADGPVAEVLRLVHGLAVLPRIEVVGSERLHRFDDGRSR